MSTPGTGDLFHRNVKLMKVGAKAGRLQSLLLGVRGKAARLTIG
jgi:hypothetical protein